MSHPYANHDQQVYLLAILLQVSKSPEEAIEKLNQAKELLKYPPTVIPAFVVPELSNRT